MSTPAKLNAVELTEKPVTISAPRTRVVLLVLLTVIVVAGTVQVIRVLARPPEVRVVAVRVEDVSRMLAVTGRIEALQMVLVSPQFSGRITEIVRHEGDRVTKGEILARLADASARSNLAQQKSALSSKLHDLAQAQRDLARTSSLVANGASTSVDLESARLLFARATDDVRRLSAVASTTSG